MNEVGSFVNRNDPSAPQPVEIVTRNRFNPNLTQAWFGSVMELINNITMLAIILTGAALIREREHGTLEHLLVMPVTAFEIMASKVWSMALVVMAAAGCSLIFVIHGMLQVPVEGSVPLFMLGSGAAPFRGDFPRNFSGDRRSEHAPARHAADSGADAHADAFRGHDSPREHAGRSPLGHGSWRRPRTSWSSARRSSTAGPGFDVVWKPFLLLAVIGSALFVISWIRFRRTVA